MGWHNMATLNYLNFLRDTSNDCANLVLACVDFRFRKPLHELFSHSILGEFDLMAMPGASKAIIDESSRESVFRSIDIIIEIHGTRRIIIVDHIDCGAYGGSASFGSPDEEESFHVERLCEAVGIMSKKYPSIEVLPMYIDWSQLKSVVFSTRPAADVRLLPVGTPVALNEATAG